MAPEMIVSTSPPGSHSDRGVALEIDSAPIKGVMLDAAVSDLETVKTITTGWRNHLDTKL